LMYILKEQIEMFEDEEMNGIIEKYCLRKI
jgi:hypothetical protein